MRDEETVLFVLMVLGIGSATAMWSVYYTKRHATEKARLEVIKQALEHPHVDERTKGDMMRLLAEDHRLSRRPFLHQFGGVINVVRILVMSVGWILFLVGGGVLALYSLGIWHDSYMLQDFGVAAIMGFVLMTLPAAIRELSRRSGPTPVKQ